MTRRFRLSRRAAGGGGLIALGVAILLGLAAVFSYAGPGPKARPGAVTTVMLARGSGVRQIGQALKAAGVIGSATLFDVAARLTGTATLKAGEYEVPSGASMARVLADIRAGKVVRHLISIPEGWTSGMALDAVAAAPALTGAAEAPPEGSLLPDTYEVQRGETRAAAIQQMRDARNRVLEALWAARQPGLPLATPQDAVTLASIVEKETGLAAERPRIAAIFINRLRAGMALQSDPTIIYSLTRGRPLGRGIRASELASTSPYNTYRTIGLPPTPIANPGRAALEAVLNPPKTDELYFVADGTGGHAFASTYEAHAKNVERWRAIEKAKASAK